MSNMTLEGVCSVITPVRLFQSNAVLIDLLDISLGWMQTGALNMYLANKKEKYGLLSCYNVIIIFHILVPTLFLSS